MGTYSVYDIALKCLNCMQGNINAKFWKSLSEDERDYIRKGDKQHFLPDGFFDGPTYIDIGGYIISDSKISDGCVYLYSLYDDFESGLSEKFFDNSYWVYAVGQFNGYVFRGFEEKKEAKEFLKSCFESPDLFDAVMVKMGKNDITDFIPMDLHYPVKEIIELKYGYYSTHEKNPKTFIDFFLDYAYKLNHREWQLNEDDRQYFNESLETIRKIKELPPEERKRWTHHLYEILDLYYRYIYNDCPMDLDDFKLTYLV